MLFLRNKHSEFMVPQAGLEPARRCQQGILSPWCLPIPPLRHIYLFGAGGGTRTHMHKALVPKTSVSAIPPHPHIRCSRAEHLYDNIFLSQSQEIFISF